MTPGCGNPNDSACDCSPSPAASPATPAEPGCTCPRTHHTSTSSPAACPDCKNSDNRPDQARHPNNQHQTPHREVEPGAHQATPVPQTYPGTRKEIRNDLDGPQHRNPS